MKAAEGYLERLKQYLSYRAPTMDMGPVGMNGTLPRSRYWFENAQTQVLKI